MSRKPTNKNKNMNKGSSESESVDKKEFVEQVDKAKEEIMNSNSSESIKTLQEDFIEEMQNAEDEDEEEDIETMQEDFINEMHEDIEEDDDTDFTDVTDSLKHNRRPSGKPKKPTKKVSDKKKKQKKDLLDLLFSIQVNRKMIILTIIAMIVISCAIASLCLKGGLFQKRTTAADLANANQNAVITILDHNELPEVTNGVLLEAIRSTYSTDYFKSHGVTLKNYLGSITDEYLLILTGIDENNKIERTYIPGYGIPEYYVDYNNSVIYFKDGENWYKDSYTGEFNPITDQIVTFQDAASEKNLVSFQQNANLLINGQYYYCCSLETKAYQNEEGNPLVVSYFIDKDLRVRYVEYYDAALKVNVFIQAEDAPIINATLKNAQQGNYEAFKDSIQQSIMEQSGMSNGMTMPEAGAGSN